MINHHDPLYETTVFENARVMTENVAMRCPNRIAFIFRNRPTDPEPVQVTFRAARDRICARGTALIATAPMTGSAPVLP